jgi:hypothetical protein
MVNTNPWFFARDVAQDITDEFEALDSWTAERVLRESEAADLRVTVSLCVTGTRSASGRLRPHAIESVTVRMGSVSVNVPLSEATRRVRSLSEAMARLEEQSFEEEIGELDYERLRRRGRVWRLLPGSLGELDRSRSLFSWAPWASTVGDIVIGGEGYPDGSYLVLLGWTGGRLTLSVGAELLTECTGPDVLLGPDVATAMRLDIQNGARRATVSPEWSAIARALCASEEEAESSYRGAAGP